MMKSGRAKALLCGFIGEKVVKYIDEVLFYQQRRVAQFERV